MKMNRIRRTAYSLGIMSVLLGLTGCASIVNGTNQVVSVRTVSPAGDVAGATCALQNEKGAYYVTTPGTVTVHRAYGDMNVKCEKAGFAPSVATFKSSTKAMMAGNIVFGGVIGAGVDAASGAAYDYPSVFEIMLNGSVTHTAAALAPTPGVATPAAAGGAL